MHRTFSGRPGLIRKVSVSQQVSIDDFKVSVQNHDKVITLVKNGDLSALINGLTKLQGFILQNAKPDHGMLDASILLGSAIEKFCQARYEQEKTRYRPNGTINEEKNEEYENWIDNSNNYWAEEVDTNTVTVRKQKGQKADSIESRKVTLQAENENLIPIDEKMGLYQLNPETTPKYRKKIVVYAFQTDDPCTLEKSWGLSSGGKGDWVIAGDKGDVYMCSNELFIATYEPSSSGAHRFQKKGYIYAQQVLHRNFMAKTKDGYQDGNEGDYLLQDPNGEQWTMTSELFNATYEPEILTRHTRMLDGILEYNEEDDKQKQQQQQDSVNYLTHETISYLKQSDQLLFNIFKFSEVSQYHPLSSLALYIFQRRGLLNEFNIDPNTFSLFINEVESTYHDNPYHNRIHAADVLHSCNYIINNSTLRDKLTSSEILACLIAACVHDIGHPGTNNAYQIREHNSLALCYNDRSVLENFHCATAFHILRKKDFNILPDTCENYSLIRNDIIEMVLSTDLAYHKQYLLKFDGLIDEMTLSKSSSCSSTPTSPNEALCCKNIPEDNDKRLLLMVGVIKSSDIGHPFKNLECHQIWSKYVNDEFAAQAKQEELRGLPVSFDIGLNSIKSKFVQSQIGFLKFLVDPLIQKVNKLIGCGEIVKQLDSNLNYWIDQQKELE